MKNIVIKYGSYGFILALIIFLSTLYFGQELDFATQEAIGYISIIASLSVIYFGIKHYRDKVRKGYMGFRRAVLTGLLISVLTGLGIALADVIYLSWINPDFFVEYSTVMRNEGYKGEIPDYGNGFMAMVMFMTVMVVGLIISLISALILKRK